MMALFPKTFITPGCIIETRCAYSEEKFILMCIILKLNRAGADNIIPIIPNNLVLTSLLTSYVSLWPMPPILGVKAKTGKQHVGGTCLPMSNIHLQGCF